jgi:hypothetical protein
MTEPGFKISLKDWNKGKNIKTLLQRKRMSSYQLLRFYLRYNKNRLDDLKTKIDINIDKIAGDIDSIRVTLAFDRFTSIGHAKELKTALDNASEKLIRKIDDTGLNIFVIQSNRADIVAVDTAVIEDEAPDNTGEDEEFSEIISVRFHRLANPTVW